MSKAMKAALIGWFGLSLIMLGLNFAPLVDLWSIYGIISLLVWPLGVVVVQILSKDKSEITQSHNVRNIAG
jgi:hypothetical protein